jgi:rRNA maturation endonuclease Nob1
MPMTELQIRALAHKLHRCRDCKETFPELDTWGRCDKCAEDIAREVAAAESAAGWDPYP